MFSELDAVNGPTLYSRMAEYLSEEARIDLDFALAYADIQKFLETGE